jgi:rhamnogalacturonyl hydrolase YesR
MWRQLIDHPEAWIETSSTAMFPFALLSGVKNGWLEERTYAPAARKGWRGLVSYISADGDISDVCDGANKKNDLQYYLNRARKTATCTAKPSFCGAPMPYSSSELCLYAKL